MSGRTIAYVASEITPFAKTGGLADVSGALPAYLSRAGHDVRAFLPLYSSIEVDNYEFDPVENLSDVSVDLGSRTYRFSLFESRLPGTDMPVYFVHCPLLFDRPGLYTDGDDEPVRFALFSRAVLESCQRLGWSPEIIHCNDWQTGLIPLLVNTVYSWDELFHRTRSVFAIHNLGYQGVFPASVVETCGLAPIRSQLDPDDLKAGHVGFLKTGLTYADAITTVSPTYAEEIRTADLGMGLHALLERRKDVITGILNGVDQETWDPRTDPLLTSRYSIKSLWRKEKNKEHLLTELGLPYEKGVPVVGIVTRLAYQKGIVLLEEALPAVLAKRDFRVVVLASGEKKYERFFSELQREYPGKVCFYQGYHDELAHWIEAGSDMFLMPSKYEPCGLNQMYSLLYGTIPIVRKTGGLADTVQLYDPQTGEGNGIVFDHYTAQGVQWALESALDLYQDSDTWKKLMIRGMSEDFSWGRSGPAYLEVYDRVLSQDGAEV